MKRVVLITGAAGGIGGACVRVFNHAGWTTVGIDRRQPGKGQETARHFIEADVCDPGAVENLVGKVSEDQDRLDAVVNNAAVQICKPLLETSVADWDLTMATNVRSAFILVRAVHPLLKESRGAVVNVSSVHAVATSPGMAAYAASKGALVALTRAMALELAADGIRVNAVLPGAVDTPMLRAGLKRGRAQVESVEDLLHALAVRHAVGRLGSPEEIGRAILFLADAGQSSFITGQTLTVDGGATARLGTE